MVALIILLFVIVYFLWRFEQKKLRAREITVLATMTAICVACNEICAHTIPLHAGTAIVVLTGIALGPQAGFFVGATARFICNLFSGQGAWTPWQMIAWGLIGALAGIAFNQVKLRKKYQKDSVTLAQRLSLEKSRSFEMLMVPVVSILIAWIIAYLSYLLFGDQAESFWGWRLYLFGAAGLLIGSILQRHKLAVDDITITVFTFVVVFIIYGGVMNAAAMFLTSSIDPTAGVSLQTLKALYITGVPYDIAHAATAALCVFFAGDGILQKLQRIQVKFGIRIS